MMGPFATAVSAGCLEALRWLLWLVAVLLVLLVVVQAVRGDDAAQPEKLLIMAAMAAAFGWLCSFVAGRLIAAQR